MMERKRRLSGMSVFKVHTK